MITTDDITDPLANGLADDIANEERGRKWDEDQRRIRAEIEADQRREREEAAVEHAARLREAAENRLDEQIPVRYCLAAVDAPEILAWAEAGMTESDGDYWLPIGTSGPDPHGHYQASGPSLLILGPVGTGKTYQAYGLVSWLFERDLFRDIRITTAVELYARLRPRDGVDTETEFEKFARADLLMIDDLGTGKNSEWVEEINYRLIDYRYNHELTTIFTSNVPPRDLGERLGDRTASRLTQMCTSVVLKGQDRRRAAA